MPKDCVSQGKADQAVQVNVRSASMAPVYQRTIKSPIWCTGTALHLGDKVEICLKPAPIDHGVVFKRVDVAGQNALIPATWDNVIDTQLSTVIGNDTGLKVMTIEHLMAAFAGMGIDNVLVEINGSEVPAMDGSSAPFTFLLEYAGIETQNAPRKMLEVLKPVTVQQGDKCAVLAPSKNGFALDIEIDFAHAAIRRQRYALAVTPKNFKEHVAPARTFGFVQDVEMLQKMGLARGADLTNAVALQGDTILNEEGLRFQNEFARHKTLDALGDLYTSGFQIRGRYRGMRPGHHINNCVLQALFADATNYRFVTMTEADLNIETSLPESSVARAEKKALQRMAV